MDHGRSLWHKSRPGFLLPRRAALGWNRMLSSQQTGLMNRDPVFWLCASYEQRPALFEGFLGSWLCAMFDPGNDSSFVTVP